MPELSRFYGIIIRMFVEVGGPHHEPHFHAYYQEHIGVFSIDPNALVTGDLPNGSSALLKHGPSCMQRS